MKTALLLSGLLGMVWCSNSLPPLVLDGNAAHHTYDGFGGLSAGASSRLLQDYPLPQRSDILDLLYLPNYGAGLKIFKCEIGGDDMSTDGTEPSHSHFRGDLSCDRGYELWLATEALARNPLIKTYALSWGTPGWVGNGSGYFTAENWAYQAAFATCFKEKTGASLDYIGVWNERSWGGTDYIVGLRAALDAAGHSHTQIVLPDSAVAGDPALLAAIANNATFGAAFAVAGLHGRPEPVPILEATGHRYWQSETGTTPISLAEDWRGAQDWAQNLIRNYVVANITGTVSWSTIWSVLPGLPYDGRGLMMANTPWSGSYNASAPIWVSAHFGQHLEVGWKHLLTGRGAGFLPIGGGDGASSSSSSSSSGGDAGSYMALVPPTGPSGGLTLLCETMHVPSPSTRVFSLTGGLPGPGTVFHVWQTTDAARFVRMPDAVVASDGSLTLALPADGMVSASTVAGARHGQPASPPPPPAPLALPYRDSFNESTYAYDSLPRYLSDQGGSFSVRNGSLVQVVTQRPGLNDWYVTPDPITLLGDYTPWADVTVAVSAWVPTPSAQRWGAPPPMSPPTDPNDAVLAPCETPPLSPYSAQTWAFDSPYPGYLSNTVTGAQTCLNLKGCGTELVYYECCQSCGCYNAGGFQFSLAANGSLTAGLLPGLCATAAAASPAATIAMAPCAPGGGAGLLQQWAHNSTTKQLSLAGGAAAASSPPLCLQSTLHPQVPYVQLCARVTQYSGFDGIHPVPGYCLRVETDGTWQVLARNVTLGAGTLPQQGGLAAQPMALEITVKGSTVSARAAGSDLGAWPSGGVYTAGMVALGSGVHEAVFDDFSVEPAV